MSNFGILFFNGLPVSKYPVFNCARAIRPFMLYSSLHKSPCDVNTINGAFSLSGSNLGLARSNLEPFPSKTSET